MRVGYDAELDDVSRVLVAMADAVRMAMQLGTESLPAVDGGRQMYFLVTGEPLRRSLPAKEHH